MSGIKDSDNIEHLRNRLYQRGTSGVGDVHHGLTDAPKPVPTDWHVELGPMEPQQSVPISEVVPETYNPAIAAALPTMRKPKQRGYRLKLALLGVAFFGVALVISSMFMVFGRNGISGDNIEIALTVPFTVGGGEVMSGQVGITNGNSVALESATLIVEYPPGTKSDEENPRDLYTERIPLESVEPGETLNLPLRVRVFGEENSDKTIKASVEYRVQGSSARLFKEAPPQTFKISSAPVSFKVDGVKQISSGQEMSLTLTIVSNSLTPLSEVLVKAEYPVGFEFKRANPEPVAGKNSWLIENVEPQSSHTITITGVVVGQNTDKHVMKFSAGIPNERDQNSFASVFANAETVFEIERAFIDLDVEIGGSTDAIINLDPGQTATGIIEINNTLSDSIYDLRVVVTPSGSAFESGVLRGSGGFYDSNANTLTWDASHRPRFKQLSPGEVEQLNFTVRPSDGAASDPSVKVKVNVYARRVQESNVAEELLDSVERTVRISSAPELLVSVDHGSQVFSDTGPIPPEVGEPTTYTVSYRVMNGTNNITGTAVSTRLPLYVTWLDKQSGDGRFEYNQTTRTVTWYPGTISSNGEATASMQVSLLPSSSQIGITPILIAAQSLTATDSFTGEALETSGKELTTELPSESGFGEDDGEVVSD